MIVYQSMHASGDELRAFDLDSGTDTVLGEFPAPFNRGTSKADAQGYRYTTVLVADSSDVAVVDLEPVVGQGVESATDRTAFVRADTALAQRSPSQRLALR